jgi:hypothetical protein
MIRKAHTAVLTLAAAWTGLVGLVGLGWAYLDPSRLEGTLGEYLLTTLIAFLFAAYPTAALIRGPMRRWKRRRNGLCINCGYNLTGNVSGVCPECGTPK